MYRRYDRGNLRKGQEVEEDDRADDVGKKKGRRRYHFRIGKWAPQEEKRATEPKWEAPLPPPPPPPKEEGGKCQADSSGSPFGGLTKMEVEQLEERLAREERQDPGEELDTFFRMEIDEQEYGDAEMLQAITDEYFAETPDPLDQMDDREEKE